MALDARDLSTARAELQAAAGTYEALHLVNPGASCWRSALALALAAEDPAEARRLASRELKDARRAGLLRPAAIALRARGMLEGGQQGQRTLHEAAELAAAPVRGWSTPAPWSSSARRYGAPTSAPPPAGRCAPGWTWPTAAAPRAWRSGPRPSCWRPAPDPAAGR
jgi:hypothetical protein